MKNTKLTILLALSSLLAISGCKKDGPVTTSQNRNLDFKSVSIDSISEPASDGTRTISLSFSDSTGENTLKMEAGSAFRYLEAGYYELVSSIDDRLEAKVSLSYGEESVDIESAKIRVRRNDNKYYILWEIKTGEEDIRCVLNDKKINFDKKSYESFSSGGTGTVLADQTLTSRILMTQMKYSIYLPKDYDETKEYPILYILHGMWSHNNEWFTGGALNAYASAYAENGGRDMIIVSPDGKDYFYCNGYTPGINYMSYFFEEFIPHIESTYAVKAERGSRAIGGLSMGGYGSLYYALLHPEMFCHVYACSAAVNGSNNTPGLSNMLGELSSRKQIENLPGMSIEIGTEDFLFLDNQNFLKTLDAYKVAYEYITRPGAHTWEFWNACSPKIISKVGAAFE